MLHPEGPQIAADLEYLEVLEYFGASFEIYLVLVFPYTCTMSKAEYASTQVIKRAGRQTHTEHTRE